RPKEYIKGPDVMSKSTRTQERYRKAFSNQSKLDSFLYSGGSGSGNIIDLTSSPDASDLDNDSRSSVSSSEPVSTIPQRRKASRSPEVDSDPSDPPTTDTEQSLSAHSAHSADPTSPMHSASPTSDHYPSNPQSPLTSSHRSSTHESDKNMLLDHETDPAVEKEVEIEITHGVMMENDIEDLEDELDENVGKLPSDIRPWDELRDQLKNDLKMKKNRLSLSEVNKMMILVNFANLRLKGESRMQASEIVAKAWHNNEGKWFARRIRDLARHYQVFEQLPKEHRGGSRVNRSWLHREEVRSKISEYLRNLPTGKVTPRILCHHINTILFPELGIKPKSPISIRTARRWLINLGWTYTVVKKGVYMDGHERADVVQYRHETFLPLMKKYEERMACYELDDGKNLKKIPPKLESNEKELIPLFHDESAFHHNDHVTSLWLKTGQQPLRKKGRGRLIHVSEFINPETGRLTYTDENGKIIKDARKIIYPGSNGDPWWDTDQLLNQMETAIEVFELQFPGKQALFVFDNSSAHGSLPPDALKAFEMNKTDGGKQRRQKNTFIPTSNPNPALRGKFQSMVNDAGQPKGLENVLKERGFNVSGVRAKCKPVCPIESQGCCMARILSHEDDFRNQVSQLETLIKSRNHEIIFLPKFHCELNPIEMYWGWVKYRYREEDKVKFDDAKQAAVKWLDACPTETICRFINRSFRYMDAYRKGLTGKAAEWAVKRHKQHRTISQRAMMSVDAVLNT
ncbi:hypothetical protein K435DRAFT_682354, partial [Dendrothele bispora CBS 962.96]